MKKILITGANSYIGTCFENYVEKNLSDEYAIETVDMIDSEWQKKDFSGYDVVFHVAGIAHRKETDENRELYFSVNRDLAFETAKKAKNDGVGQFIFLSSMSVYGLESGTITKQTVPNPKSAYGLSKLEAEEKLNTLSNENFKICTIRPPMVYGKGCKGNFQTVVKLVKKLPVFPRVKNQRSMIYIDNLNRFVALCVQKGLSGVYLPQNKDYVNTTEMAQAISCSLGKRVYMSYLLGLSAMVLALMVPMAKKAFGSLVYKDTEDFDFCYCQDDGFEKSV